MNAMKVNGNKSKGEIKMKKPGLVKILVMLGVVAVAIFVLVAIFSSVVNVNNCAGIICLNFGG